MPWFASLIPTDTNALVMLDWTLHIVHFILVLFVMSGWMFARLRRLHMILLLLVWFSWTGLGLYIGNLGYCWLTDWQWQVKTALGEGDLPASYLEYIYRQITGYEANSNMMTIVAVSALVLSTAISIYLNYRTWKRRNVCI